MYEAQPPLNGVYPVTMVRVAGRGTAAPRRHKKGDDTPVERGSASKLDRALSWN